MIETALQANLIKPKYVPNFWDRLFTVLFLYNDFFIHLNMFYFKLYQTQANLNHKTLFLYHIQLKPKLIIFHFYHNQALLIHITYNLIFKQTKHILIKCMCISPNVGFLFSDQVQGTKLFNQRNMIQVIFNNKIQSDG